MNAKPEAAPLTAEPSLRLAQDMLFFAMRDLGHAADPVLRAHGFGRAHHRALHFIAAHQGLTVGELLAILGITKQSLARVLAALIAKNLVQQSEGSQDRRQRILTLTSEGAALEGELFDRQSKILRKAYQDAGSPAVAGFTQILQAIMGPEARGICLRQLANRQRRTA